MFTQGGICIMLTTNERPIPTGEGLTFEKVWAMFQETDRKFQETREQMEETSRSIKVPPINHLHETQSF